MKTRKVFLYGAIVLLALASCAQKTEPLFGTWVNEQYKSGYFTWKFTYMPNGHEIGWHDGKPADQPYNGESRFSIAKKWVDSEGNTWYSTADKVCLAPYSDAKAMREYGLVKVHADGSILEGEWSSVNSFEQFGTLTGKHYVYYRR